jgi:hypothetical protein
MKSIFALLVLGLAATPNVAKSAGKMPPFKVESWLNSAPLTPDILLGKVVLIDVWEYTCINWIRTAPFVKAWHRDYAKLGLVVVGLHAPEFEFGKRAENIERGAREHGLLYPVALDNNFASWRALRNEAWPTKYLFDAKGKLVRRWVGEGSYHEIEAEIRRALLTARPEIELPAVTPEATAFAKTGDPSYRGITAETYLGAQRGEPGVYRLEGEWRREREYLELKKGTGKIILTFTAGEVNLVMQPGTSGNAAVTVLLDGKTVVETRGADVGPDGVARFDRSGMIRLVSGAPRGKHVLTLLTSDPGIRAFAFTFGP